MRNILLLILSILFIFEAEYSIADIDLNDDMFGFEEEIFGVSTRIHDPYEKFNRKIFIFNDYVDYLISKPIGTMYYHIVPSWGQSRVSDFVSNLSTPITALSSLLSGNMKAASNAIGRFLVNSTLGIFGLFDVAKEAGLHREPYSFENTLHYYGAHRGPYLVLPLLGPSSPRGILGMALDWGGNPMNYRLNHDILWTGRALQAVDTRSYMIQDIDPMLENSLDKYALVRSFYAQRKFDYKQQ